VVHVIDRKAPHASLSFQFAMPPPLFRPFHLDPRSHFSASLSPLCFSPESLLKFRSFPRPSPLSSLFLSPLAFLLPVACFLFPPACTIVAHAIPSLPFSHHHHPRGKLPLSLILSSLLSPLSSLLSLSPPPPHRRRHHHRDFHNNLHDHHHRAHRNTESLSVLTRALQQSPRDTKRQDRGNRDGDCECDCWSSFYACWLSIRTVRESWKGWFFHLHWVVRMWDRNCQETSRKIMIYDAAVPLCL